MVFVLLPLFFFFRFPTFESDGAELDLHGDAKLDLEGGIPWVYLVGCI